MAIYAIGDLHLSFNERKPMDIFGENWKKHEDKIKKNWQRVIKEDDLVILPGDFSWAINLKDTVKDFEYLNELPGRKVLIKGNHDYWWTTLKSMNDFLQEHNIKNIEFILNTAIEYENKIIVGTRGWTFCDSDNSKKMLKRELMRLENSITYGINSFGDDKEIICAMHYPPITKTMIQENQKSKYLDLLNKHSIRKCLYGHLHGKSHCEAVEGNVEGVELKLVSCDYLDFTPLKVDDYLICCNI